MSSTTADVVIVGAGVIGSSVAFELSKLGRRVVVVEKAGGAGHGSTSASSAVVRFNYLTFGGVAAAWESKHYWDTWAEHLELPEDARLAGFQRTGVVMLDVPLAPRDRVTGLFDEVGVLYEEWNAETLAERVPHIDVGRHWPPKPVDADAFFESSTAELGALFTPDGGFVDDPQLAAYNLAAAAGRRGAAFAFNREVTLIEQRGGRVQGVVLSDGTRIAAPVLINAAGPWSSAVNALAGVGSEFTIGLRPMRQEVHQVRAPAGYNTPDRLGPAIADLDLGTYMRAAPGDWLLVGGTEPECDAFEWVEDPDGANPRATAGRFRAQITRAARRLPELTVPNAPSGVAGVYDVAADWTPIYDRTDLDGFYVAIGTSGNQFKNAPLVGRFIAELVERVEGGHNHDTHPLSYQCVHTGHHINLGAYSRKRPFNKDSSGTVMG